ncbi:MAG: hypothetical protein JWO46_222 [Nocardioidaceae bacterium]|nr:hypothetical protein [Nocardioidaceae bacterium]
MTDLPPPPGSTPPGPPAPGSPPYAAAPPPPAYAAQAPVGPLRPGSLHKPGTVPLRPLGLTDFFDAAFTTIRRNPRATIGVGALVTTAFMLVPIVGAALLAAFGGLGSGLDPATTSSTGDASFDVGTFGIVASSLVSSVFGGLANVVVAGLVVPVVTRASIGETVSPSAAWRQARGCLLRLVGLALLEGVLATLLIGVPLGLVILLGIALDNPLLAILLGIVVLLASVLAALAMHVRWFQLAAPTLVVEKRGVIAATRRAGRLTRGGFWRILGVFLLVTVTTYFVGQVIGFPFGILGAVLAVAVPGAGGTLGLLLVSNLATIISGAVIAPFTGTVAVLQYLDQRFRNEGFDIELIEHVQQRSGR